MRIITKRTLREYWERHPDARRPLLDWYKAAEQADWEAPRHIRERYPSANIIAGNRVVFNVKGNTYRLEVKVNYAYRMVYIRFIGTHAEYDAIDATEV